MGTVFLPFQLIAAEIRDLLGIELIPWDRSIAEPPRDPMGLFLEQKRPTGTRSDALNYTEFVLGKGA